MILLLLGVCMFLDQLTSQEQKILNNLNSPKKIQNFLNQLPINFEPNGDECKSPRRVLREGNAHCIEGAMLAALAFYVHGERPLLLDLTSRQGDDDHVVALFKRNGCYGAISKTNHAVLRYREPIYKSVRELVMSYFHEYFLQNGGVKTLRSYAVADISKFDKRGWMTDEEDVWYIAEHLCDIPHKQILTRAQIVALRPADAVEIKSGELLEWPAGRTL